MKDEGQRNVGMFCRVPGYVSDVYLHSQLGAISHPAGVHLFKIKNNGMIHHEHDISMDANGAYF